MACAYLARLVELLLQPRHRHSAFRRPTSHRDPANRRDSASDRLPGAADPPCASAGPVGTASAALLPAPLPPLRRPSPSRARAARILHGNRTLPAPSAHARPLLSGRRTRTSLAAGAAASASEWTRASLERPWRMQRRLECRRWL